MWSSCACCVVEAVLLLTATCLAWCFYNKKNPPPIFGVYKQQGKWFCLKYFLFQVLFKYRVWQSKRAAANSDGKKEGTTAGYGVDTHKSLDLMDQAQPLSDDPLGFDAVFFIATSQDGFYLIVGTERRQHNIINGLCYLVIPGKGLLCSRKIPDTILFGAKDNEFGAEGILVKPTKAMKKWRLEYEGKMYLQSDPTQEFDVTLEADWTAKWKIFNFDTDMPLPTMARCIAKEDWTRQYFENLKEAHQTHYEQMGSLSGVVRINGSTPITHPLNMQSFRDHSYGKKRDWTLMHRYAFHMFFLEDGTTATVGVICQPCTCSTMEAGYVCLPGEEVHALEWCDLKLYQHGENGTPPTDYAFQFKAGDTVYTAQVNVEHQNVHYVGWNWEARMVERFIRCNVNGVPGRGVSEFHYRNKDGRPASVAASDPNWFQQVKRQ